MFLLIDNYEPDLVALRYAESFGRKATDSDRKRARIEGVLAEAAHSRGIEVVTGPLRAISQRLKTDSAKAYLDSGELRGLQLDRLERNCQEAVLAAISALPNL